MNIPTGHKLSDAIILGGVLTSFIAVALPWLQAIGALVAIVVGILTAVQKWREIRGEKKNGAVRGPDSEPPSP